MDLRFTSMNNQAKELVDQLGTSTSWYNLK